MTTGTSHPIDQHIDRVRGEVRKVLHAKFPDRHQQVDRDEVVNEVYVKLRAQWPNFDPAKGQVGGWVSVNARWHAVDVIKALLEPVAERLPGGYDAPAPAEPADDAELGDRIAALPPKLRSAVECIVEGLTLTEAGAKLGVSRQAATTRVHRAHARLAA